jgi:hypothetical protein
MRRRHHREHAAFEYRKPTFPSDRQGRSQNFERILPFAVQDVRKPEADLGEDSRNLAARPLCAADRLPASSLRAFSGGFRVTLEPNFFPVARRMGSSTLA